MPTETLTMVDFLALQRLKKLCDDNALSFRLEYSEAEGTFELHVRGAGKGEDFYVKRSVYLHSAVEWIEEQWLKFLESLKA